MAQQRKKSTSSSSRAAKRGGTSASSSASAPDAAGTSRRKGPAATRRSADAGATPGWVWLLGGVIIGALAFSAWNYLGGDTGGLEQRGNPGEQQRLQLPRPGGEKSARESGGGGDGQGAEMSATQQEGERAYEFYDILMQDEVIIPEDDPPPSKRRSKAEKSEEKVTRAPTIEEGHSYMLQAGSFRNQDDAEHMRASLALVGLRASIYTVELEDGQSWYRVRVGPFEGKEKIQMARKRMQENNIEPLLLRTDG